MIWITVDQLYCRWHYKSFHTCFAMVTRKSYSIILCALCSHQWRDAQRRGLYFWPIRYSTPPIPFYVNIMCILIIPIANRLYPHFKSVFTLIIHSRHPNGGRKKGDHIQQKIEWDQDQVALSSLPSSSIPGAIMSV